MSNGLSSTDVVERELAELQRGIQDNLRVLQQLQGIQQQFSGLVDTHNEAKAFLKSMTDKVGSLESRVNTSVASLTSSMAWYETAFSKLEQANTERWQEYQATLLKFQRDYRTANSNFRTELEFQWSELQQELEKRLELYQERLSGFDERLAAAEHLVEKKLEEHSEQTARWLMRIEEETQLNTERYKRQKARLRQLRILSITSLVLAGGVPAVIAYLVMSGAIFLP